MSQENEQEEILQLLQAAIQREVMAAKLYREAAVKTSNPKAKRLLEQLAAEEQRHRELLSAQYQELAGHALYEDGS